MSDDQACNCRRCNACAVTGVKMPRFVPKPPVPIEEATPPRPERAKAERPKPIPSGLFDSVPDQQTV